MENQGPITSRDIDRMINALFLLPEKQQIEAFQKIMTRLVQAMPLEGIEDLRDEILERFAPDSEIRLVQETVSMLDGHIFLRVTEFHYTHDS